MASLPPRQQSQRRSHEQSAQSEQQQPQAPASPVRARSATSEDSQTLFINNQPLEQKLVEEQQQQSAPAAMQPPDIDDPNLKKCWICFSDSTEDTPETSPWRDPCPCALVAHEECLLDWIADQESPKNHRNHRGIGAPKILCPQCKSEIKLARPTNVVVEAVRALERAGARAITPGALTFLSASLYQSSMAWGMHSIYAVFGPEDGFRILRPLILNTMRPPLEVYVGEPASQVGRKMLGLVLDHLVHWRLYVGLPLITPVLILSRTKLADSILPVLPILFFATQTHNPRDHLDLTHWPPSASMCFAVLPYLRTAYNTYFEKVWGEKEKRWMKEIQPRQGQNPDEVVDGGDNEIVDELGEAEADQEENVFEVRIDRGLWDDWEEPPAGPQQAPPQAPPANPAPPAQGAEQADPPPDIADDRPAQQAANAPAADPAAQPARPAPQQPQPANQMNGEHRLSFSPTAIAETVLGAILFPTIAGLSGEVLKLLLPSSWTAGAASAGASAAGRLGANGMGARIPGRGILSEKWGRSLVGGCLFVVAKDAVMLYVRWRMAAMHRERRVLDYDKAKKRYRS